MASTINLLRLLADPTRLRLLLLLEEEELSVAELQEIMGMGQSRISSHLAQLKRAGVVGDRRSGKNVYYGEARPAGRNGSWTQVREIVRALAHELPETARDRTALKLVLHKRADKAREYFDELAGKFGRSYVPGRSWQALAHTLIRLLPPSTVADLGAGEGTLSQLLAENAHMGSKISSTAWVIFRIRPSPRGASISPFSARPCITPSGRNAPSRRPTASCARMDGL